MFPDVKEDSYALQAIEWARKAGIISGFPDGTFRPLEPVTREQMAVMFYKQSLRDGVFTDILPEIMPSVVMVFAGAGLGSGVCIKNDGINSYILTNCHVVEAGSPYTIIKDGKANTPAELAKKGSVFDVDLAILKTTVNIPPCKIAVNPVEQGQAVCVVGSPSGLTDSVSVGIVSNPNRDMKWVQTDAHINPGNSGGG